MQLIMNYINEPEKILLELSKPPSYKHILLNSSPLSNLRDHNKSTLLSTRPQRIVFIMVTEIISGSITTPTTSPGTWFVVGAGGAKVRTRIESCKTCEMITAVELLVSYQALRDEQMNSLPHQVSSTYRLV
ncbi:hypothetical protein GQX74_002988 [Glossina fuscipes]|uniref:Uncharacterized protein n=1 Tax=Glossina palpalis gambiensis TaxID=67801 RepID=A0A1B0B6W4_9MUSC|nr:hypothetical protein GQX74_002988 [Glossina fuscipes]